MSGGYWKQMGYVAKPGPFEIGDTVIFGASSLRDPGVARMLAAQGISDASHKAFEVVKIKESGYGLRDPQTGRIIWSGKYAENRPIEGCGWSRKWLWKLEEAGKLVAPVPPPRSFVENRPAVERAVSKPACCGRKEESKMEQSIMGTLTENTCENLMEGAKIGASGKAAGAIVEFGEGLLGRKIPDFTGNAALNEAIRVEAAVMVAKMLGRYVNGDKGAKLVELANLAETFVGVKVGEAGFEKIEPLIDGLLAKVGPILGK